MRSTIERALQRGSFRKASSRCFLGRTGTASTSSPNTYFCFNALSSLPNSDRWNSQSRSMSIQHAQYGLDERLTKGRKKKNRERDWQRVSKDGLHEKSAEFLDALWHERYQELKAFQEEHGRTTVQAEENLVLANWVKKQRMSYRQYKDSKPTSMTHQRIRLLEAIPTFSWSPKETVWMQRLHELKEFKETHGHCVVPLEYPENPALARFVTNMRQSYREFKGEIPTKFESGPRLKQHHIDLLNAVGFVWDMRDLWWDDKFRQLEEYVAHHGDTLVPFRYSANPELGRWVRRQREMYAARMGIIAEHKEQDEYSERYKQSILNGHEIMTDEKMARLNQIGFVWNARTEMWEQRFQELQDWVRIHGLGSYPKKRQNSELYEFLQRQRKQHKKGKLLPEREAKLSELGLLFQND